MKYETVMLCGGAAGVQGSSIVTELLDKGYRVKTVARNQERCDLLKARGVEASLGDLEDVNSLISACKGANAVIYLPPLEGGADQQLVVTNNVIEMAKSTNIEYLIFKSSRHPEGDTGVESFDIKHGLETQLVVSGIPCTTLNSTIYMENFAAPWSIANINEQSLLSYPVAADTKIAWNSIDDMARFVVASLDKPGLAGRVLNIGGPQSITGEEIARQFSTALGREIRYEYIPRVDFAAAIAPFIGEVASHSVCDYYKVVESYADAWGAFEADVNELGCTPIDTFETWAGARKQTIFK